MHPSLRDAACVVTFLLVPMRADAQLADTAPAARERSSSPVAPAVTAGVLERAAYVRAVLNANPSIEAARYGWRAALARVRQAGTFDDPMIEMSMAPLSIGSSSARFGYEVGIRQELPWFGKRARERDVMVAEAAAAASDLATVRRELAMTAVQLYAQYYVAFRALEINARHAELLQSLRAAATTQLEVGRGSTHEVLQAEAELTHLERDALVLEADRDVTAAQMNELLHRDPGARLPPPVVELAMKPALDVEDSKQLGAEAAARRTEISSARFHARAEAAKAEAAARDYGPTFALSTSYSSMWDMPEHRWVVGVGVNVPLPTDARAARVDEAHAAHAQYQSEVDRMRDLAKTQVYVAMRKLHESARVLQLFQARLLPVAHEQVEAARAELITSQTSFGAVVEAERNLRSVELDEKLAQAESDRRYAELQRALGRIPGLDGEEHAR